MDWYRWAAPYPVGSDNRCAVFVDEPLGRWLVPPRTNSPQSGRPAVREWCSFGAAIAVAQTVAEPAEATVARRNKNESTSGSSAGRGGVGHHLSRVVGDTSVG